MTDLGANFEWRSSQHRFIQDHPTAAGHFPGNPIIPGALLLDHILRILSMQTSGIAPWDIRFVKFLSPVRPGDSVTIRSRLAPDGEIAFECHLLGAQGPALAGSLRPRAR